MKHSGILTQQRRITMHECPDCGAACYCGGDIDDCMVYSFAQDCTHYLECQSEADEDQTGPMETEE